MKTTLIAILVLVLTPICAVADDFLKPPWEKNSNSQDLFGGYNQSSDYNQQQNNAFQEQYLNEIHEYRPRYRQERQPQQRQILRLNPMEDRFERASPQAVPQWNPFTKKWEFVE